MLCVCTFGGLTLQEDGVPITGAATHRRQLALLALLAVAGDTGLSREKILAYLWPESDTDHARHALNQLLYLQRHHAREPGLFLGRKTLRLQRGLLDCDVWTFEAALAEGEQERAIEVYRGPFLDGFFLDGAGSFERWASESRARFAGQYLGALQTLAEDAAAAGAHDAASEWRRQAAATDPLNSRLVTEYVETLLACENRAGALRVLEAHRHDLRDGLGLEPEPALAQLEARIRGRQDSGPA